MSALRVVVLAPGAHDAPMQPPLPPPRHTGVDLASCTPEAVVCDDTGPDPPWWFGLLELAGAMLALVVAALVVALLLQRASRPKPVTSRVWIDAYGDVVRRRRP